MGERHRGPGVLSCCPKPLSSVSWLPQAGLQLKRLQDGPQLSCVHLMHGQCCSGRAPTPPPAGSLAPDLTGGVLGDRNEPGLLLRCSKDRSRCLLAATKVLRVTQGGNKPSMLLSCTQPMLQVLL